MNHYQHPENLAATDVCSRCKAPLFRYHFDAGNVDVVTWYCPEHGPAVPMRSHVSNPPAPHRYPSPPETLRLPAPEERCDERASYEC